MFLNQGEQVVSTNMQQFKLSWENLRNVRQEIKVIFRIRSVPFTILKWSHLCLVKEEKKSTVCEKAHFGDFFYMSFFCSCMSSIKD